jgi:hypothetical protein
MKKQNKNSAFLVLMLLLCVSFEANAQDQNWYNSFFKLLKPDQYSKIEDHPGPDKFIQKEEKTGFAIHNINKHLDEVAKLRAQGKTKKEIRQYFDAQRKAVGTGSISGMVYESDGVTPIQDYVSIWTYNEYGHYSGYKSIFKSDSGAYVITELSADNYYVRTETHGRYRNEYYDDVTDWREATLVPVTDGQETSGINFILDYGGAISGQVSNVDGAPLDYCGINAYDENYNWVNSSSTDENGFYVVSGLPSGRYKVQVEEWAPENYLVEWYDNAQSFETATVVTVREPDTTKGINFILDYGGAIAGRVFDATGVAVVAYDCHIAAYDTDKSWINSAETDENGNFVILQLHTGVYKLRISYYGQENYVEGWYDGARDFESATSIGVTAPDTTKNVHIILQAGGVISGQVFGPDGQPLTWDCDVIAYDVHQDQVGQDQIRENGEYAIRLLPTGRYKLFAEYRGHTSIVGQEPASEWYDGVYEFEEATFVEVIAPDTTGNIDFTMEKGGYIMGRVYGPQGQILSYSGNVYAFKDRPGVSFFGGFYGYQGLGRILNDGLYFITGLPTGEYKLQVQYEGEEGYVNEWYEGKQNFETATPVSVTAPYQTPNINFTLEYPGIIQGFVTDASGNRLTEDEHPLEVFIYDANSGKYIDYDYISFVGGYQFELMGRNYKLAAVSFYSNWLPRHDSLAVAYYENGTSFNDPNTQTISLAANSTLILNDFVIEKANGAISGTIYNEVTAQPMIEGGYLIFVFDEDGYLAKVSGYLEFNNPITGEYLLCGLRPGNYYLLAIADTDPFVDPLFQWYDGIEADIDLETFTPSATIPANVSAVTVGEGLTSRIDFYFKITTEVNEAWEGTMAQSFKLHQNYPNPFNPSTKIKFALPKRETVKIEVYNIIGQKISTLLNSYSMMRRTKRSGTNRFVYQCEKNKIN